MCHFPSSYITSFTSLWRGLWLEHTCSEYTRRCCDSTQWLEGTRLQETQSRSKQALVNLCGLFVVWRTLGGSMERRGEAACFTSLKIRQKVIDFPMTYPTPQHTPLRIQTAGVGNMHTISHTNMLLKPGALPPTSVPATTPSSPISPWLSLSPFPCLIYAFAEQLLPRELREQHSHLSTLVTRCHLLLPAHRTSRQTMPHAFWTSDLRRLLQRGLGGALDSNSHGWWSLQPRRQWHLQLVHTQLKWKAAHEAFISQTASRYTSW